jgi:NTE family protein
MASELGRKWPPSPYKGLGFYTEADAPLFAGRDNDIVRCAAALAEWKTRLLLLHGSTGCGKSSFLRAGLIPHLETRSAGIAFARIGAADTPALFIRSTAEPVAKLAKALYDFAAREVILSTPSGPHLLDLRNALPDPNETDSAAFLRKYGNKHDVLLQVLKDLSRLVPDTLVLIIDQGEEVLTADTAVTGEAWRNQFFELLSEFTEVQCDVKLLIALRTEYLGRFATRLRRGLRHPGVIEFFLDELNNNQIKEAVLRPTMTTEVGRLGAPFEHYRFSFADAVVDQIIEQLGRGAGGKLSALQIVCTALFDLVSRREEPREITFDDFKTIGGVEGSIERFLDNELLECGKSMKLAPVVCAQEIVRWKDVLHGLAHMQPDGTITTDLKSEKALREELEESRLEFVLTTNRLISSRLLRETPVVDARTGQLIRCFGLGHDTLGLVLRNWKVRHESQIGSAPVQLTVQIEEEPRATQNDIALCLSGGGYRSMLFNLGAVWRLNELGYLSRLARISGVSGGAIVTGLLGAQWRNLAFRNGVAENFLDVMVRPIRDLANQTIDVSSVLMSFFFKGGAENLASHFERALYGYANLQDLPNEPVIVISATNLQRASLFRFSKAYLGDYEIGQVPRPKLELAKVVAASTATPPILSPLVLKFGPSEWDPHPLNPSEPVDPQYREKVYLTDGAVYDHLGLEVAWTRHQTLLISDGGAEISKEAEPSTSWISQVARVLDVIDHQLRQLRRRQVIDAFATGQKQGAYWSIRSRMESYQLPDALPFSASRAEELSQVPSRFAALEAATQEQLINWGYAICDTAMRKHMPQARLPKSLFPYPKNV